MTMPTREVVLPGTARAAGSRPRVAGIRPGRLLVRAAPPVVTLAVTLWGITSSSYWRDEAATLVAVHRSFGQLLRLLGHVDAVHSVYYMAMWVIVRVGGSGELVTRLPSALAMAAAAAAVAAMATRLVSAAAGLAAGLVFAVIPAISLYAQNARPDAFTVALAAWATYLLVRALLGAASSRRRLVWYAVCLAALGLVDFLCLLLVAAHAVTVAVAAWREKDRGAGRALVLRWLAAVLAAVAVVGPLAWLAKTEQTAIHWIKPPGTYTLPGLAGMAAPMPQARTHYCVPFSLTIVAVIGLGLLVSAAGGRVSWRRRWPLDIVAVSLPWLVVPVAILLVVSFVQPVYNVRYTLFCLPALALLAGVALAALGRLVGAAALVLLVVEGWQAQLAARQPDGRGENIRRADQIVAAAMHRGDVAIFNNPSEESWSFAYPYGFAQLRPINQAESPAQSGTLTGTTLPNAEVRQRLAGVSRVWVVNVRAVVRKYQPSQKFPEFHEKGFRLAHRWRVNDIQLFLYTRTPGH